MSLRLTISQPPTLSFYIHLYGNGNYIVTTDWDASPFAHADFHSPYNTIRHPPGIQIPDRGSIESIRPILMEQGITI